MNIQRIVYNKISSISSYIKETILSNFKIIIKPLLIFFVLAIISNLIFIKFEVYTAYFEDRPFIIFYLILLLIPSHILAYKLNKLNLEISGRVILAALFSFIASFAYTLIPSIALFNNIYYYDPFYQSIVTHFYFTIPFFLTLISVVVISFLFNINNKIIKVFILLLFSISLLLFANVLIKKTQYTYPCNTFNNVLLKSDVCYRDLAIAYSYVQNCYQISDPGFREFCL